MRCIGTVTQFGDHGLMVYLGKYNQINTLL